MIFAIVLASMEAKSKCAKLGIAKTGFQNPQKGEERKKLKTVSSSLKCYIVACTNSAEKFIVSREFVH